MVVQLLNTLYSITTSNTINTDDTGRRTMDFILTSKIPIYEQVKNQLKKYIALGIYSPKDKLPSVRELATSLNVNPNTIERAFNELEKEEVIYSINKKGFFVSEKQKVLDDNEILKNIEKELLIAKKHNVSKKEINDLINSIYKKEETSND